MEKLYTATATAIGGREGQVKSDNGALDVQVRVPKEMGGPAGNFPNPEMLFAGGYAACFGSALDGIIRRQKVTTGTTSVKADVSIGKLNETAYGLAVTLAVNIPGIDQKTAEELVKTAHQVCPYSNAIHNNVEVQLSVTTKEM